MCNNWHGDFVNAVVVGVNAILKAALTVRDGGR